MDLKKQLNLMTSALLLLLETMSNDNVMQIQKNI